jgi:hypothetical protein
LSWFVMGVVLLVLWRTIAWLSRLSKRRTWSVAAPALRRRPRRHRRLGDATRRRVAVKRARELVAALAQGWPQGPAAHLSDGVVLGAGEIALQRSKTQFSVWTTRSTWLIQTRARGWGRRAESSTGEVSVSGWQEHGEITWLATSARLCGRAKDGETFSIWWARLDKLEVDLDTDRMLLGTDGWRASLIGPGVAPIAVAAVAACHGRGALLAHPGLARLRILRDHPGRKAKAIGAPLALDAAPTQRRWSLNRVLRSSAPNPARRRRRLIGG